MCVWTNLSFVYSGVRFSTRRSWVNVNCDQAPALALTALSKQKRTRDTPERENEWRVERKKEQWNRPSGPVYSSHLSVVTIRFSLLRGTGIQFVFILYRDAGRRKVFPSRSRIGDGNHHVNGNPLGVPKLPRTAPARARGTVDGTPTWGPILLGNCATRPQHPSLHRVFHNAGLHSPSALPVTVHPPPRRERLRCRRIRPVTQGHSAIDLYSLFPLFYGYGNTLNFVL